MVVVMRGPWCGYTEAGGSEVHHLLDLALE